MKSLRIFAFLILLAFSFGSFQLSAAPKTLDEIESEQKKKEEKQRKEKPAKTEKTKEKDRNVPTQRENPSVYSAQKYTVIEDIIGFPKPFEAPTINNSELMNADPKAVELFEQASKKEKDKDCVKNPAEIIALWQKLAAITENNPFVTIAQERISEWNSVVAILDRHQENLDKISKLIPANVIAADQKISLALQHLDEFGLSFGAAEILNITQKTSAAAEIAKNESLRTKISEILTARCEKKSGKDCFSNGRYFSKNEDEKISYFTKACNLNYNDGCKEVKKIKAAAEAEKKRKAAEEKRKAEEEAKRIKKEKEQQLKNELNQAGRKKRLAIATSTFVPGIVITILGGVSFAGMNKAEKDRKRYYEQYLLSDYGPNTDIFRKKAQNADKKRKTYMGLGFAGIGVGVALIATGITFYSIEFEGEKEVKKKYNLSFGASPMDGTLQFALRW